MQASHLPDYVRTVMSRLEHDIDHCSKGLELGQAVELDGSIKERYGNDMVAGFLETQLTMSVNRPVIVSDASGNGKTLVQLDPKQVAQYDLPMHRGVGAFTSGTPNQPAITTHYAATVRKNPPRPMNCWMLYRDTRHREFKEANVEVTVQTISSICSRDWKKLSTAQKDEWRAKAQAAKDEHQRMYPDYKYSPRKPGQKKKRQSRKSAQTAAAIATMTAATVADFNSHSDSRRAASGIVPTPGAAADAIATNISSAFSGMQQEIQREQVTASEFDRQGRLARDLGIDTDKNIDLTTNAYGFRNGKDMNLTMPTYEPEGSLY